MAQKVDADTEEVIDEAVDTIELEENLDEANIDETQPEGLEPLEPTLDDEHAKKKSPHPIRKRLLIALAVLVVLAGVFAAIPFLRYGFVGLFVRKTVTLQVTDDVNHKPVSGVSLTFGRDTATTDKSGNATFTNVPVGDHYLSAEKKYYKTWSGSKLVPIFNGVKDNSIALKATGRTITVTVKQRITGKPVADAQVVIGDTSAVSDTNGVATVVVAADSKVASGTIKADHFTDATFALKEGAVDDQTVDAAIVPAGRVFYLSKQTGVINLMSANLDSSDAKVIVAGTGKEFDRDTVIAASSDWSRVVLRANREGKTRLYLVNTADGSVTKIDDEDATYGIVGWLDNYFIYIANRTRTMWQSGQTALKSYDVAAKKLRTIDETSATGTGWYDYTGQSIGMAQLVNDRVLYIKNWYGAGSLAGKMSELMDAQGNGVKAALKSVDASAQGFGTLRQYGPNGAYVDMYDANGAAPSVIYDYKNGTFSKSSLTPDAFNNLVTPTYMTSPSGKLTAWSESRDGKDTVLTGNEDGAQGKQLGPVGYKVYGWFTDEYVLLTKNGSELYVYPANGGVSEPVKITDYHKPAADQLGGWYGMGA